MTYNIQFVVYISKICSIPFYILDIMYHYLTGLFQTFRTDLSHSFSSRRIDDETSNRIKMGIFLYIQCVYIRIHNRRKIRSQTSDNMDRWKAEMGRVREEKRREEKKKEDQKRESFRRKKIQVREKVGKSRNTVFFLWFVAPEGRKVSSLKRRVQSQLARWEMKNSRRCGAKHISKSKV